MPRRADKYNAEGKPRTHKVNTKENGHFDMTKLRKQEKGKLPLRIHSNLVLFVSPEKCNEAYAEAFRARMNNNN